MKNSKFNSLFKEAYSRYTQGNGFLVGDVVKLKSGYESVESYKELGENVKQRLKDIVKSGNNIRVGRLHNVGAGARYNAEGSSSAPANYADCYEEVSPGFWRNLITIPVECLEEVNLEGNLPPVPENQKDTRDRVTGPEEVEGSKDHKDKATNEQTKLMHKQTHADKGDYDLATKNTKLAHSNKHNDELPPKVKGMEKAKELKESLEDLYIKILTEDVGTMGSSSNVEEVIGDKPLIVNGKEVDDIQFGGTFPDDVYVHSATFADGTELTEPEIMELQKLYPVELDLRARRPGVRLAEKVCPICGMKVCQCNKETVQPSAALPVS